MIRALRTLTLDGFRGFRRRQEIPLDADVVLLFGENGSGKSSILAGIEYSLTGHVRDLKRMVEDYPECLTHVARETPATAELEGIDETGEIFVSRASGPFPNERTVRHFLEHSYLSQRRLSELIGTYQGDLSDQGEGLSRFIRDLLGIGLLDDITSGLHEAGDIRRIRNSVEECRDLKLEVKRLEMSLSESEEKLESLKQRLRDTLAQVRTVASNLADLPVTAAELDSDVVRSALNKLRAEEAGSGKTGGLAELRRLEAQLESGRLALEDPPKGVLDPAALKQPIQHRKQRLRGLLEGLEELRERLRGNLKGSPPDQQTVTEDLRWFENHLRREVSRLGEEVEVSQNLISQKQELEVKQEGLEQSISVTEEDPATRLSSEELWLETLRHVLDRIDDDICPICHRDYSEVDDGSLQDHVAEELERLQRQLAISTERLQARLSAETELREVRRRLESTDRQLASRPSLTESEEAMRRYEAFLDALQSAKSTREECERLEEEIQEQEDGVRRGEEWLRGRAEAANELRMVASEMGIPSPNETPLDELLSKGEARIEELRSQVQQGDETRQEAIRSLEKLLEVLLNVEEINTLADQRRERKRRLEQGAEKVETVLSSAREIRDMVGEVKADLIRRVFTAPLNDLWQDLFSRMVRNEVFLPKLGVETAKRGELHTSMGAEAPEPKGREFTRLDSVLSAGNINTAALSFFLAFSLVQESVNQVLILDDPVQSMDDLHAVELANVLRSISRQTGRQLIVAIHEEPLLEYLEVELGPTVAGRELLTLRVSRDGNTSRVTDERRRWEGDRLSVPA